MRVALYREPFFALRAHLQARCLRSRLESAVYSSVDSRVVPTIDPMIPKTNPSPMQPNAKIVRLPSSIPLIIFP
jgi:hypothetical protein